MTNDWYESSTVNHETYILHHNVIQRNRLRQTLHYGLSVAIADAPPDIVIQPESNTRTCHSTNHASCHVLPPIVIVAPCVLSILAGSFGFQMQISQSTAAFLSQFVAPFLNSISSLYCFSQQLTQQLSGTAAVILFTILSRSGIFTFLILVGSVHSTSFLTASIISTTTTLPHQPCYVLCVMFCNAMTWHDTTLTMTMNDLLWHQTFPSQSSPTQKPPVQSNWCILYTSVWSSTNTYLISLSSPIARDWHIDSSQSLSKSDRIHVTELWLLFTRYNDTYCYHIRFVGSPAPQLSPSKISSWPPQQNLPLRPRRLVSAWHVLTITIMFYVMVMLSYTTFGNKLVHFNRCSIPNIILQSRTTTRIPRCTFV